MSSFPASPSPSNGKGKGGFDGNEDELWEAAFAKMDDKCHCFKSSPAPKKTPRKFSRDVISNLNPTLVQFYWRREFLGMCLVIAGCITASLVFTNLRDLTLRREVLTQTSWFRPGEGPGRARVLFEIGISQSLPDLRHRAYTLCSIANAAQTYNLLSS